MADVTVNYSIIINQLYSNVNVKIKDTQVLYIFIIVFAVCAHLDVIVMLVVVSHVLTFLIEIQCQPMEFLFVSVWLL
jgi:hypothetical protein